MKTAKIKKILALTLRFVAVFELGKLDKLLSKTNCCSFTEQLAMFLFFNELEC